MMRGPGRMWAMLGLLLALSIGLAAVSSVLPAEWQDGSVLPPPPAFWRLGGPPRAADLTPLPVGTPTTPGATRPADRGARGGRDPLGRLFPAFGAPGNAAGSFTLHLASLVTLLAVGLVLLYALPVRVGRIAGAFGGTWAGRGRLAALGLAGTLLGLALGALSLLTLVGAPVWVAIIALGYLAALLGLTAMSLPLGRWVGCRFGLAEQPPQVDLLAGLLVLFLLGLVPWVGGLLLVLVALPGLGAVLQTRGGSERTWAHGLPDLDY